MYLPGRVLPVWQSVFRLLRSLGGADFVGGFVAGRSRRRATFNQLATVLYGRQRFAEGLNSLGLGMCFFACVRDDSLFHHAQVVGWEERRGRGRGGRSKTFDGPSPIAA